MTTVVIDGCAVVTMDPGGNEYAVGHVVTSGARLDVVAPGPAPRELCDRPGITYVDGRGCLATPGLVNSHHHLAQWVTRGLAVDFTLFEWLTTLYPVWAGLDEDIMTAAATAGLAWLARTGCSTTMDHHYVFPRKGGDLFGAEVAAARHVGLRFLPTRGSMDLGRSRGGLPPDEVVEEIDAVLRATHDVVDRYHDASPDSMLRVGVAPCSPFSATTELMKQSASLARAEGVRLHTHLAETTDEAEFCEQAFGCAPIDYVESVGWLGSDVWLAHGVHFDDAALARLAATGTGVSHCPSSNARLGAGVCRTSAMHQAGVAVGLGVDGSASNEASSLVEEVRHALLFARATGGPQALTVRAALEMGTIGGARVLGWDTEIGSLEVGKLADVAVWRLDGLAHAGIADPVAALVLGAPPPLQLLLVQGSPVVDDDRVVNVDQRAVARDAVSATRTLLARAGVVS